MAVKLSVRAASDRAVTWALCADVDCVAVLGQCLVASVNVLHGRHPTLGTHNLNMRLCRLCVLWGVPCCCGRWGYFAIGCFWMFVVFWGLFITGERCNPTLSHLACSARV
mgnify:CR=1